jgi:hypothetical protein
MLVYERSSIVASALARFGIPAVVHNGSSKCTVMAEVDGSVRFQMMILALLCSCSAGVIVVGIIINAKKFCAIIVAIAGLALAHYLGA